MHILKGGADMPKTIASKIFSLVLSIIVLMTLLSCTLTSSNDVDITSSDTKTQSDTTTSKEDNIISDGKYTVSFNTNGGTNINSIDVIEGSTINEPDEPTKKGYIFNYWEYNDEERALLKGLGFDITNTDYYKKVQLFVDITSVYCKLLDFKDKIYIV